MKIQKRDLVILVVPVIIMLLLTPILPNKVPIHWSISGGANSFIDKKYSFILGVLPFVIYKSIQLKYGRR
jgi:uncharacterized membrane protein